MKTDILNEGKIKEGPSQGMSIAWLEAHFARRFMLALPNKGTPFFRQQHVPGDVIEVPIFPIVEEGVVCLEPSLWRRKYMLGYFVETELCATPELPVEFNKTVVEFLLTDCFSEDVFVHLQIVSICGVVGH